MLPSCSSTMSSIPWVGLLDQGLYRGMTLGGPIGRTSDHPSAAARACAFLASRHNRTLPATVSTAPSRQDGGGLPIRHILTLTVEANPM